MHFPIEHSVALVERDDEGRFATAEHIKRFNRLRLETVHNINHENGQVAQRTPSRSQVCKGFVTWGIDDE